MTVASCASVCLKVVQLSCHLFLILKIIVFVFTSYALLPVGGGAHDDLQSFIIWSAMSDLFFLTFAPWGLC